MEMETKPLLTLAQNDFLTQLENNEWHSCCHVQQNTINGCLRKKWIEHKENTFQRIYRITEIGQSILEKERLRQESQELFNSTGFQRSLEDIKENRLHSHEDVKKELNN